MMGIRMMNPTSKKTGMASRNAADGECCDDPARAQQLGELAGQGLGAAGDFDHLAEHGAEADEDGDGAEGAAHAFGDGFDDVRQRNARHQGDQDADNQQRQEGRDLELDDGHQQQGNACCGYGQKSESAHRVSPLTDLPAGNRRDGFSCDGGGGHRRRRVLGNYR